MILKQTGRKFQTTEFIGIVVFTLCLLFLCFYFVPEYQEDRERIRFVSTTEYHQIKDGRNEDTQLFNRVSNALELDGHVLPADVESKTFYLPQSLNSKAWNGKLSLNADEVRLVGINEDWKQKNADCIRENQAFQLLIYTDEYYAEGNLIVTGMPMLNIRTEYEETPEYDESDIDNFVFNSDTKYYGEVTIFNANGNSGTLAESDGNFFCGNYSIMQSGLVYHERGNTSHNFKKKGYAVKLIDENEKANKVDLFGLGKNAKYKLLAMPGDANKVREKVAWQLWAEMMEKDGEVKDSATTMEYCEVVKDGEYLGLYAVIKSVDENTLDLQQDEILYKILQAEMPDQESVINSALQNYPVCYPIRVRYPNEIGTSYVGSWEQMMRFLNAGFWDRDTEALEQVMDLENLTDYFIFLEAVSGADNSIKNTYMALRKDESGEMRFHILPWDLDYTFGNEFDVDLEQAKTRFNKHVSRTYMLPAYVRLFEKNNLGERDRLYSKWLSFREDILSNEHVSGLMEKNMEYLLSSGAFKRDAKKWGNLPHEEDLTEIQAIAEKRLNRLDRYFLKLGQDSEESE